MHIGNSGPMTTQFWMVYGEGQGAPTYKHDSKASAAEEATRLALRNPGIAFYVLKASGRVLAEKPVPVIEKLAKRYVADEYDGLPF